MLSYRGELLTSIEADNRIPFHGKTGSSYMFYFDNMCIDATNSSCLARFVNDSPLRYSNCKMSLIHDDSRPHLCLTAIKDIKPNEELRYDYGDKKSNMFWRHIEKYSKPFTLDNHSTLKNAIKTVQGVANLEEVNHDVSLQEDGLQESDNKRKFCKVCNAYYTDYELHILTDIHMERDHNASKTPEVLILNEESEKVELGNTAEEHQELLR